MVIIVHLCGRLDRRRAAGLGGHRVRGGLHLPSRRYRKPSQALTSKVAGWKLVVIGVIAIAALICVAALFAWINRRFAKLSTWFFHPHEDDVPVPNRFIRRSTSAKRSWPTEQNRTHGQP
jgi:hypothetical protein